MTIRFTCSECSSVLKIKDELAGTSAKCPKCKTKFVVPEPSPDNATKEIETLQADSSNPEANGRDVPDANGRDVHEPVAAADDSEKPAVAVSASETDSSAIDPIAEQLVVHSKRTAVLSESPTVATGTAEHSAEVEAPLRLDESDDEIDAPAVLTTEVRRDDDAIHSPVVSLADDDDDSPPVFVSPIAIPKSEIAESSKAAKTTAELETPTKKARPAASRDEAFDPMKYLMSDDRPKVPTAADRTPDSDADLSLSEDSEDVIESLGRPTPQPLNRPSSAGVSSRATPEKVDLATAARMMKKAIKDSQAEAAHQRELEAKQGFDYTLFFREFGVRGFAILGGGIAATILMLIIGRYVFSNPLKLPQLGYVRGTIKMDGQPLAGATVYFEPAETKMEGTKRDRARTSVGTSNQRGEFTMMYLLGERIEGVAVGKCHVWVSHMGEKGEDVPPEWLFGAGVSQQVTPGHQKTPIEISMDSRKDPKKK